MSKPKYMKGDCIRSLDDLVLQENIYWNGRIWNRKWFINLQIQTLLSLIKHKALQYAVRLDGSTMGELVEPVLWHKIKGRPLTDAEKAEFSEHGYSDFEIPEYMVDLETLNNTPISRLVELAEADKDGRCVVLPCKVGDKLYRVFAGEIFEHQVGSLKYFAIQKRWDIETYPFCPCVESSIGKTVFLSREEAEKALQEMEDKKDD